MKRVLLALCAAASVAMPAAASQEAEVRLPTEGDAVAIALGAETILLGPLGVETLLPGTVHDEERVTVGLRPDGGVPNVVVEQRLRVTGLGDFEFKIPGPARSVEALPGSENDPGLRRGSVLWQGFSDGEKHLGARMELFADQEEARLPLAFDLSITVDGRPLGPGETASGIVEVRLVARNVSAIPVSVSTADVDVELARRALDAVRARIARGERPVPGRSGIPEAISAEGPVASEVDQIEAPFRIEGAIDFSGAVSWDSAEGLDDPVGGLPGDVVTFDAALGGGAPLEHEVVLRGRGDRVVLPRLDLSAEPAVPLPPADVPDDASGREVLAALNETLWQTAMLRRFDAYLGNPDAAGPARSIYTFRLALERDERPASAGVPETRLSALGWWLIVVALLVLALVAWSYA